MGRSASDISFDSAEGALSSAERAILVGIEMKDAEWSLEDTLSELERLVDTAGAYVVGTLTQKLTKPIPATFIGSGKAEELAELCRSLEADLVVFDEELTPSQQFNLEKIVPKDVKVIDRTALILDIFGLHAQTREGRLQVRLAQNQYLYPRLRGMWAHLASNKMGGGVGSRFGEGESQLEVDRRMVRKRITSIRRELADLAENRSTQRKQRQESGMFRVSLAGYTNAGKSSLLNALTNAEVLSYDKLFATLDSTTRKLVLPEGRETTLTDTVGFIQKLPTTLVESFKSTLDEILGSDLILHVVDASSEHYEKHIKAVLEVLDQIKAQEIPLILVFNKIDMLSSDEQFALKSRYRDAIFVSSLEKTGFDELIHAISLAASAHDMLLDVLIPYNKGQLVSLAHERCRILSEEFEEEGTRLSLQVPATYQGHFSPYALNDRL